MSTALAPMETAPLPPGIPGGGPALTRRQKAAIVVRLLLADGITLPLTELPDALQAELTTQMSQMRYIDRTTLHAVIEEFADELDSIGMAFPGGLEGALEALEGAISPDIAARLRRQAGLIWADDPWEVIAEMEVEKLLPLLQTEGPEIGAVILSKLKVAKAAALLERLPGAQARRLTYAMSLTSDIDPDTVRKIGVSLAALLQAEPPRAFPSPAVKRVGAILNVSPRVTREDVLEGLDEEDKDFAEEVRRAIFTFQDIPARLDMRDVPNALRNVDQDMLKKVVAAADATSGPVIDFLLDNLSKRLAQTIREEAADLREQPAKEIEDAQRAIVTAIRDMADAGEITLQEPEGA
ncbi:flagellar motor switch protein FliG [Tranquillimonas rosea]|uniref:Flagellar motor switch protein FliG n=1 Tax=Tranquillimonas rosea TaxID=641238 RepID=A0A1H9TJK1_9RHOB|nr:FliG C-terminal domain-containing protein [Tranquillimonas rosea]SER97321.1 flagellar motor switch protein FliG [Tranquillimonas rosea]